MCKLCRDLVPNIVGVIIVRQDTVTKMDLDALASPLLSEDKRHQLLATNMDMKEIMLHAKLAFKTQ